MSTRWRVGRGVGTKARAGFLALFLCGAASCGGGSGSPGSVPPPAAEPPVGNLTFDAQTVSIPTEAIAGQTIPVSVMLEAEAEKYNVGITLDVVPATGGGAPDPYDPQYDLTATPVDGAIVPMVPVGDTMEDLQLRLPPDLPAGPYNVVLNLNRRDTTPDDDPLQQEAPGDELDNSKTLPVVLNVSEPSAPNLFFVDCHSVSPTLEWSNTRVYGSPTDNTLWGPTVPIAIVLQVGAEFQSVPAGGLVRVEVQKEGDLGWSLVPLRTPEYQDGHSFPVAVTLPELRVGSSVGSYDLPTDATRPTDRIGSYLDALVPDWMLQFGGYATPHVDYNLHVRCTIYPPDQVVESDAQDNVCEFTVKVMFPDAVADLTDPPVPEQHPSSLRGTLWNGDVPESLECRPGVPIVLSNNLIYWDSYGNSDAVGLDLRLGQSLSWRNAAQNSGAAPPPVTSLFDGYGKVHVDFFGKGADVLDVRGGVYFSACEGVLRTGFEVRSFGVDLWDRYTDGVSLTYEKSWSKEIASVGTTIIVAGFPVHVRVGAEGSVGIGATFGALASSHLSASVGPEASLSAFAEAGLDVVVASAGVGVNLTVLNINLALKGDLTVPCPDDGPVTLSLSAPWTVRTLDGHLYVWVKYPNPKPLDLLHQSTSTHTILDWRGIQIAGGVLWTYEHDWQ